MDTQFRLFGFASVLAVLLGLAAERSGLMTFRESFQFPLWIETWLFKRFVFSMGEVVKNGSSISA
jgi:hypothetical protein